MTWSELGTDFVRRMLSREALAAIGMVILEVTNELDERSAAALIAVIVGRSLVKVATIWNDQRTDTDQVP